MKIFVTKVSDYEKELADCRLLISQQEARMVSLNELMKELEQRKRTLEEDFDALREECAKFKAAEQVQAVSNKEKAEEKEAATKIRVALEEQMDQLRDVHQKQVVCCFHYYFIIVYYINEDETY